MDGLVVDDDYFSRSFTGTAKTKFRTDEEFYTKPFASGYTLFTWLHHDQLVPRELKTRFRSLATQCPAIQDLPGIEDQAYSVEYSYNARPAKGLGYADLIEGIAVSFTSLAEWNTYHIPLLLETLDEHGEILTEEIVVHHASRAAHILQDLHQWIHEQIFQHISHGEDLWQRREELFPYLTFCQGGEQQIRTLQRGDPVLLKVAKRLSKLNEVCQIWQEGPFPDTGYHVSPESPATLSHPEYARMRTFAYQSESEDILFSLHIRVTPGNWRIYYYPKEPGKVYIGHVGRKLPTVDYPT